MQTSIPKLTPRLRKYVLELAADPSEFVARTFALLKEHEESYARLSPSIVQDVMTFLEYCAKLWFNTLGHGTLPSKTQWSVLADAGRRRVHQGIPLPAILQALRIGGLEVWKACVAVPGGEQADRDELLFSVSNFLLEFFDLMSQTMSQAYLDEQFQGVRWRDSLRHELTNIIFQFPDDLLAFKRVVESLNIDPTVPRVGVALDLILPNEFPATLEREHDRAVLAMARRLKTESDALVRVFRRGRLIVWVPTIRGESVIAADRRMAEIGHHFLKVVVDARAIGIGLMNQGPAGWALTADEACKALEFGLRSNSARAVHMYSDIAVHEGVRRTDNVLRYLNSLIERLAEEPDLLSTLQSYFDHRQHRRITADVLGIHPNTLNHRLERIEALLGASLEEAAWVAKLHVVLRLRQ